MKIWLVVMINRTEPEQKVYLLGAHSSADAAGGQRDALDAAVRSSAAIVEMEVDGKQPPVLVGVAPSTLGDCKKNTPNG